MYNYDELVYSIIEIIGRQNGYKVDHIRSISIPCLSDHFSDNPREQGWYTLAINIVEHLTSLGNCLK